MSWIFLYFVPGKKIIQDTWSSGRSSTLDPLKVVAVGRNLIQGVGADCEMCIWYYLIMSIGTHWKGSICDKLSISDHWKSLNQDDDAIWFQTIARVLPSTDKIHTRHQERSGSDLAMAETLHSNGHRMLILSKHIYIYISYTI